MVKMMIEGDRPSMKNYVLTIDRSITFKQVLWFVPILLALHNIEEALTMPRWVPQNLSFIQSNLPFKNPLQFSPTQLLLSLVTATVIPIVVTMLCIGGEKKSRKLFILFLLQGIVLLNVFVPHVAVSFRMMRYNPGVITAVCFNLPFSLYLFQRAYRGHYLALREFVQLFFLALLLYPPIAWMIHIAGEWIAKSL